MKESVAPDQYGLVMHVTLKVDGGTLMGSDAPPDRYEKPQGMYVSIAPRRTQTGADLQRAGRRRGSRDAFQETFWAAGFGMTVDRFGIPWMVNCEARCRV